MRFTEFIFYVLIAAAFADEFDYALDYSYGCESAPTHFFHVLSFASEGKTCSARVCCYGRMEFWKDKVTCEFREDTLHFTKPVVESSHPFWLNILDWSLQTEEELRSHNPLDHCRSRCSSFVHLCMLLWSLQVFRYNSVFQEATKSNWHYVFELSIFFFLNDNKIL